MTNNEDDASGEANIFRQQLPKNGKCTLTWAEVKKAMEDIEKNRKMERRFDKDDNYIDVDTNTGQIINVGLGSKVADFLRSEEIFKQQKDAMKGKVTEFMGIKIVTTDLLQDGQYALVKTKGR